MTRPGHIWLILMFLNGRRWAHSNLKYLNLPQMLNRKHRDIMTLVHPFRIKQSERYLWFVSPWMGLCSDLKCVTANAMNLLMQLLSFILSVISVESLITVSIISADYAVGEDGQDIWAPVTVSAATQTKALDLFRGPDTLCTCPLTVSGWAVLGWFKWNGF